MRVKRCFYTEESREIDLLKPTFKKFSRNLAWATITIFVVHLVKYLDGNQKTHIDEIDTAFGNMSDEEIDDLLKKVLENEKVRSKGGCQLENNGREAIKVADPHSSATKSVKKPESVPIEFNLQSL